jgi:hypothetical protein
MRPAALWMLPCLLCTSALAQEEEEPVLDAEVRTQDEKPIFDAEIPASEEAPPTDSGSRELVRVILQDGQSIRGHLVTDRPDYVAIELVTGGELHIPRFLIRTIEIEESTLRSERGEFWFEDVSRTRYLFGPSALMLRGGQAYFSQKELVVSEFGYGISDNFTVLAGAIPFAWFIPGAGLNFLVGAKVGMPVGGSVHLAAGFDTLVILFNGVSVTSGFVFGTATIAENNWHLSLSAGYPVAFNFQLGEFATTAPIVTVSGNLRLSQNFGLVSENWIVLPPSAGADPVLADGLSVRFLGERFSVDVGAVLLWTPGQPLFIPFPIPWLDFTYHFDLRRK